MPTRTRFRYLLSCCDRDADEDSEPSPSRVMPTESPRPSESSPAKAGHNWGLESLWEKAHNHLRNQDPELFAKYEAGLKSDLAMEGNPQPDGQISPVARVPNQGIQLQDLAQDRIGEIKDTRWKQARHVIKGIVFVKDVISQAISAEPHAALAWAGVLVILPVSVHDQKQSSY